MTITSTYDHRIIQGAESGVFLKRVQELLLGGDRFYDEIFSRPRRALRARPVAADATRSNDADARSRSRWPCTAHQRATGCAAI